jgi:hypothetical protein
MPYSQGFDFDEGSLGRNLEVFDRKVRSFLDRDIDEHTHQGELALKSKAPWRDDTGYARSGLWADNEKFNNSYTIAMGHTAEYGVYLEESNGGRFQIIMPVLVETARSFMRSLEGMFLQLETHTPVTPFISPGVSTRPGTSQGAREHAFGAETRPEAGVTHRDRAGQFADQGKGYSKAAKAYKAFAKKVAAKNARRRERYAERKAAGTLPTKRTRKG